MHPVVRLGVRRSAVVALAEVLDRQLPVRLGRVLSSRHRLQLRRPVLLTRRSPIAYERRRNRAASCCDRLTKMKPSTVRTWQGCRPFCRGVEIRRHAVRGRDQAPGQIVGPRMIRAAKNRRVAVRPQLNDREPGIGWLAVCARFRGVDAVGPVLAQARPAMPADVVKRLHCPGLVAEDDDAVAAAVFEHEVVARLGDPVLVIGHQPEMVGDEPLVVQVVLFLEVVLRRNRGAFPPSARVHRGLTGVRRLVQHHVAPGRVDAAVADFRRRRDTAPSGHRRAFGRRGTLRREPRFRRGRREERRRQCDRRRGARANRRPGKIATADFPAHVSSSVGGQNLLQTTAFTDEMTLTVEGEIVAECRMKQRPCVQFGKAR